MFRMAKLDKVGSLELEHDLDHQGRERLASRVLLVLLLAIMAATGLGLFGNGWLSHARTGSPGQGLWIEYERFGRFGAALRLTVHAPAGPARLAPILLPYAYLDAMEVVTVTPAPESSGSTPEGIEFRFAAAAAAPLAVHFTLRPVRRWRVHGGVQSAKTRLEFTQFIYP